MSTDDIDDAIESTATGPKRVTADGVTVEAQSIQDQIAAAKHVGAQAGAAKNHFGLRFVKLEPPGCG